MPTKLPEGFVTEGRFAENFGWVWVSCGLFPIFIQIPTHEKMFLVGKISPKMPLLT